MTGCVSWWGCYLYCKLCFLLCHRTMKAGWALVSALALFLLMGAVFPQRLRPKKPTKRPATSRKPSIAQPAAPEQPEPQEPTDFPPPILGPPSMFPDCPRECFCSPSYPNSLNCENRNIRVIPAIPLRTHYLYLQNNYITEVTAESFLNASDVRWINLANNRIHRIDKQVWKLLGLMLWLENTKPSQNECLASVSCRCLRRSQHYCTSMLKVTNWKKFL